jgi:2-(3-amino-3-carboxypropyl)histidine synthase
MKILSFLNIYIIYMYCDNKMLKDTVLNEIKKLKSEKLNKKEDSPLAIQIPEGLKQFLPEILDELNEFNPRVFVDPCFGACDLKDRVSKEIGCKTLIHFGHNWMGKPRIKTFFLPIYYEFSKQEMDFTINEIKKLGYKKINLVTTTNYLSNIEKVKEILKKEEIEVLKAKGTSHVREHMVLGCDSSTIIDKKNPIIYIGDGFFHPNNLGFVFSNRDIWIINPILKETRKLEINDKFIRQRYALIEKARQSKTFAILVSSKHGQFRMRYAEHIKSILESLGKKVYIFVSDFINESYILGIKVDCYVNTACPRITYDDWPNFKKPIISPKEVFMLKDPKSNLMVDQIIAIETYYDTNP